MRLSVTDNISLFFSLLTVFAEDEALVLHVILGPAELGTITVYLSVVLDLSRLE